VFDGYGTDEVDEPADEVPANEEASMNDDSSSVNHNGEYAVLLEPNWRETMPGLEPYYDLYHFRQDMDDIIGVPTEDEEMEIQSMTLRMLEEAGKQDIETNPEDTKCLEMLMRLQQVSGTYFWNWMFVAGGNADPTVSLHDRAAHLLRIATLRVLAKRHDVSDGKQRRCLGVKLCTLVLELSGTSLGRWTAKRWCILQELILRPHGSFADDMAKADDMLSDMIPQ
jgi:hypothetical protein